MNEPDDLDLQEPPNGAGGLGALAATARHVLAQMGPVRATRTLLRMNQPDGFDCPGCAWPEPEHRSAFEFCENGAKAVAEEATERRIDRAFFARHSVADLAARDDFWLSQQGRLTEPMWKPVGAAHYEPLAWDAAFARLAHHLRGLRCPNAAAFYTSGRTSNEAAFLYQLFVRAFGTNNLPDCSNLCHESSGFALIESLGVGKGTVQLEDFDAADAIFVIGQNPGTNHPRMLTTLQAAARRGCRIVSVNPLREAGLDHFAHPQEPWEWPGRGTRIADLFVPVRIGGDAALWKAVNKSLLEHEAARPGTVLDAAFVDDHTSGFEAWRAATLALPWDVLLAEAGVDRLTVERMAEIARRSERTICTWAMGLTQHIHAVETIQEVVNFLLLRGNIGRPGAGVCPVRGHSNVQGDRTMGICERPPAWLDRLGEVFGFAPPRHEGLDVVGTIEAMERGDVGVFFALGGNFLSAAPDTERTARALQRCALTAQVSTKLNRSHLVTGGEALILPCLGRTERDVQPAGPQFVTVENSMGVVSRSRGHLEPASPHLRSEPRIVADLGTALFAGHPGGGPRVPWGALADDYRRIRAHIADVVPGFDGYERKLEAEGSFVLPNAARERDFRTDTGRARFLVSPLRRAELGPDEWLLMTIRSHDQYNTTLYGLDDRYRGIANGRRVVLLAPEDIVEAGLTQGMQVDLVGVDGDGARVAPDFTVVPYAIPRRNAAAYFPEANVLVPLEHRAERSRTPASKAVRIRIQRRP
ncbi:MAG: FdhF/YdeP family oxidoreductase [Myxococcales bacterium]|nr:FdhF/YdeP family oxidoreductase [Myxococcales bacterium]